MLAGTERRPAAEGTCAPGGQDLAEREERENRRTKSEGDERHVARENVNWGDLLRN